MVKCLLDCYVAVSGQKVNLDKLVVNFSLNVLATLCSEILGCLGMASSSSHDKYLGLSTLIRCNKRSTFNVIKKKGLV